MMLCEDDYTYCCQYVWGPPKAGKGKETVGLLQSAEGGGLVDTCFQFSEILVGLLTYGTIR